MARHPSTENLMKWLIPNPNLPEGTAASFIASIFHEVTNEILELIEQDSPELTAGLRHLLEAKDAFVRAALDKQPGFWTDR